MSEKPKEESSKEIAWQIASDILKENVFLAVKDEHDTELFRYDPSEGIYKRDGEPFIGNLIESEAPDEKKKEITTHVVNEVIRHIQRNRLEERSIFEESNPHLVLENTLYNLKTKETEKFRPDFYSLNKQKVNYKPELGYKASLFWKTINELLEYDDIRKLQEALGAIFRKQYLTKKFLILEGESDTGKTTILNAISSVIGSENISCVPLQRMVEEDRFSLFALFGKMANIVDDMPKDVIKSVGKLKTVTGEGEVDGERKFHDLIHFKNHAFIICTCNKLPKVENDDDAFWNRIELITFKKIVQIDRIDRLLGEKLRQPDELSAILNWGIEGYDLLESQKWNFSKTKTIEEKKEYYKRKSEPVWAFCKDCIDESGDGRVIMKVLYDAYRNWCKLNNEKPVLNTSFYKEVKRIVTVRDEYMDDDSGRSQRAFGGIKLKSVSEEGKLF